MANSKQLKVTLLKSRFGRLKAHRDCVAGLGLRKRHQSVTLPDTPAVRGMIDRVSYLLKVEEV